MNEREKPILRAMMEDLDPNIPCDMKQHTETVPVYRSNSCLI